MGSIKIDLDELVVNIQFGTFDLYTATPMGCHAGCFGNFSSGYQFKDKKAPIGMEQKVLQLYREKDVYRKIMDELLKGASSAFGGWTMGEGSHWHKKGHWIISCPWKNPDHSPTQFGTAEIMDLIHQYCEAEPAKYGRAWMTDPSDCAAHDNNAGFPATRTLVWIPAYAKINPDKLKTRASGMYTPPFVGPPKPEIKPEPVKVEVKPKPAPEADRGELQREEQLGHPGGGVHRTPEGDRPQGVQEAVHVQLGGAPEVQLAGAVEEARPVLEVLAEGGDDYWKARAAEAGVDRPRRRKAKQPKAVSNREVEELIPF